MSAPSRDQVVPPLRRGDGVRKDRKCSSCLSDRRRLTALADRGECRNLTATAAPLGSDEGHARELGKRRSAGVGDAHGSRTLVIANDQPALLERAEEAMVTSYGVVRG